MVQGAGWLANVLGAEDVGSSIMELGSDAVDFWNDSLSNPAKIELAKQVVRKNDEGEYEWGDPSFSTIGLMGAQSLLGTAAGMGAGAGLTKVLQVFANPFGRASLVAAQKAAAAPGASAKAVAEGAAAAKKLKLVDTVLGGAGFGAGEGSIGGISAGASVYDNVMSLSADTLLENDRYQQIFEATDSSISELERHQYAADTLAKEASTAAGWQSGLTTALLGAPMGAYFGRILGGARLSSTLPRAIATGAAGEAAQEFAQSGVEQYISNIQLGKIDKSVNPWDDVFNAAVSGALAGGLLGGVVGPASVKGSKLEVRQEAVKKELENRKKIGGPLEDAIKRAATARANSKVDISETGEKVDLKNPAPLNNIVHDYITGKISMPAALEAAAILEREATTGEQPIAKVPPPPGPDDVLAQPEAAPEEEPEAALTVGEREAQAERDAVERPVLPAESPADLETVNLLDTKTDAARFQFKAQTDAEGVSQRLKGVKKFDKTKAGVGIFYEDKAGTVFRVDSHQRGALAERLFAEGKQPKEDFDIPGYVFKESDGVTPEEVTLIAATKNIAEGSGSPIDAAKVMRQMGEEGAQEMNLPPNSALVQQANGLSKLDDDAFAKTVNEVVDPRYGAIVGELIQDGPLQNAAIEVLRQTEPANATQARAIIEQVRTAGVETTETEDLFGEQVVTESLYLERAKVLDSALRLARRDKATFKTLTNREQSITGTGKNKLDRTANEAKISDADVALTALATAANTKGPISDALTEAAREVKAGKKPGSVAQGFLEKAVGATKAANKKRGKPRKAKRASAKPSQEELEAEARLFPNAAEDVAKLKQQLEGEGIDVPAMYSRARLQNRPVGGPAMAELERRVINPVQTGEISPEQDPGASLLVQSINVRDQTISLPEDNKASMAAIADTLDRVVKEARDFRYGEGWRARLGLYGKGPGFGPGRETYEEMSGAINNLQNLTDAVRASSRAAPTAQGSQEDMFGAPAAPEPEPPPPEQAALFSRSGKPLSEITITREFRVAETGELADVELNAAIAMSQLVKRRNMVQRLKGCLRG